VDRGYITSLLFSKTPLTAEQREYLQQNYSITETPANTTITKQANGLLVGAWHGDFQMADQTTIGTPGPQNSTASSPTNVSPDKTPTLADVAKAISGSASRNEDFNLLESFFNPTAPTTSGVNKQEQQKDRL
jgi:hypothetical protein